MEIPSCPGRNGTDVDGLGELFLIKKSLGEFQFMSEIKVSKVDFLINCELRIHGSNKDGYSHVYYVIIDYKGHQYMFSSIINQ